MKKLVYLTLWAFLGITGDSRRIKTPDTFLRPSLQAELYDKGVEPKVCHKLDIICNEYEFNQSWIYQRVSSIVKKSIEEDKAREYVEKRMDEFESVIGSDIDIIGNDTIADSLILWFLMDISRNSGNGRYTSDRKLRLIDPDSFLGKIFCRDCDKDKEKKEEFTKQSSIQTLSEFMTSDDGKYYGDCDDFAMALQTCYELSEKIANERAQDSGFWKIVASSFKGKQMFIADTVNLKSKGGHVLNILYDNKKREIKAIEPQVYNESSIISIEYGKIFIAQWNTTYEVEGLCNSKVCYKLE